MRVEKKKKACKRIYEKEEKKVKIRANNRKKRGIGLYIVTIWNSRAFKHQF
jgi:hypothetical protein